jgi:hypothetical protein
VMDDGVVSGRSPRAPAIGPSAVHEGAMRGLGAIRGVGLVKVASAGSVVEGARTRGRRRNICGRPVLRKETKEKPDTSRYHLARLACSPISNRIEPSDSRRNIETLS